MFLSNYKRSQALFFFITMLVLIASYYLQYIRDLQPCPLCLMQRFCVFLLLLISGISFFLRKTKARRVSNYFQIIVALIGLYFVFRQLWLQSFPLSEAPSCMPEFSVLIRYFSWSDITKAFLWGASDCGEITWSLLGLPLPAWTGLYLFFGVFMSVWGLRQVTQENHPI